MSRLARTCRSKSCLPNHAPPCLTKQHQGLPAIPSPAAPSHATPRLVLPAIPSPASSSLNLTSHACPAKPCRAWPRNAPSHLPSPAVPGQALPNRACHSKSCVAQPWQVTSRLPVVPAVRTAGNSLTLGQRHYLPLFPPRAVQVRLGGVRVIALEAHPEGVVIRFVHVVPVAVRAAAVAMLLAMRLEDHALSCFWDSCTVSGMPVSGGTDSGAVSRAHLSHAPM